jgi:hypothetical protein
VIRSSPAPLPPIEPLRPDLPLTVDPYRPSRNTNHPSPFDENPFDLENRMREVVNEEVTKLEVVSEVRHQEVLRRFEMEERLLNGINEQITGIYLHIGVLALKVRQQNGTILDLKEAVDEFLDTEKSGNSRKSGFLSPWSCCCSSGRCSAGRPLPDLRTRLFIGRGLAGLCCS